MFFRTRERSLLVFSVRWWVKRLITASFRGRSCDAWAFHRFLAETIDQPLDRLVLCRNESSTGREKFVIEMAGAFLFEIVAALPVAFLAFATILRFVLSRTDIFLETLEIPGVVL